MKEKTTLKKFMFLPVTACDAIKEELESMALKGWKLKKIGVRYEFERIEPKKLTYTVDFFPKASVYDTEPSGGTVSYIECCRQADWELVASNGTMHIFVSENEDAIPIHTDEKLRLEAVCKSMLKTNWALWFALPLYCLLRIAMELYSFKMLVTSNAKLCNVIMFIGIILFCLSDLFVYLYWKCKNRKRVKNGEMLKFIKLKTSRRIFTFQTCICVGIVIFMPLLIWVLSKNWNYIAIFGAILLICIVFSIIGGFVEKLRFSEGVKILLAFAVVILMYVAAFFAVWNIDGVEDYDQSKPTDNFSFATGPNYTYNFYYLEKSILASEEEVSVYSDDKYEFRYIAFKSNSQFIMKKYYNEYYKTGYSKLPQENESWNAKEVLISDKGNNLIVVYDNALIHFNGMTDFTEEQKSEVAEKLTKPVDGFLPALPVNRQK